MEQLSDRVYRFELKSLKDEDHWHDIVQDCFEKLWLKKEGVEFAEAKSYLFTTAYNKMVDFWRREKFRGEAEDLKEKYSAGSDVIKKNTRGKHDFNPFRVNAQARVGYGDFTLFASYALTEMYRDNTGKPEVYPFNFGISFGG